MNFFSQSIDMTKVHTVVYHLPDGQTYTVKIDGVEQFMDLGMGDFCDTSDIDGVLHFFPKGNA
ncbi:MAG: hypothetical protein M0017_03050 [Desulfobacteraceae bacterium]|nr:hypothetical protein [Desulfobacteraceae bacterium]